LAIEFRESPPNGETEGDPAGIERLGRSGDETRLIEIDDAVGEHLGVPVSRR
jgi:hypothetical protein